MATARVTANTAVQPLFSTPLHMKAIIDNINIDNEGSSGSITVQLEDDFSQDISFANGTVNPLSAFPFQTTVAQNTSVSADKNTLADTECLGNVGVKCSAIDAGCAIVVVFHFE
jgi:hypothetical protein